MGYGHRLSPAACLFALAIGTAQAQLPTFSLNGVVKSHDTHLLMPGTTVLAKDTVEGNGLEFRSSTVTDRRGKYHIALPYNGVYAVEYQAQGHVTKRIIIDLTGTKARDQTDGTGVVLAIDLFPHFDQVDYAVFDEPIAVYRFDRKQKAFVWDDAYREERSDELEAVDRSQEAALHAAAIPVVHASEADSTVNE